jgi:hypothetical protein
MIRQWFIISVLGLSLSGLSYEFINEVVMYSPLDEVGASKKSGQAKAANANGFAPAWGSEIVERNLFTSSRSATPERRVPTPIVSAPTRVQEIITPPQVVLSGIIKNQYDEFVAYIAIDGGPITGVRAGDALVDLQVLEIEDRKISLMWIDTPMTLELKSSSLMKR